jgi:ornithine carbamoyltransferase
MSLKNRDILSIQDLALKEIELIHEVTRNLKNDPSESQKYSLKGKTLALLFLKSSTRTRVSFDEAMNQLGGHSITLTENASQVAQKLESFYDTGKVLSRYVQVIMARVSEHKEVKELAEGAEVPVINGLSDLLHPCQGLSDLFTIMECKGGFEGFKLAYVGDGNNVCNSLLHGCSKVGIDISIGCPEKHKPNDDVYISALKNCKESDSRIEILQDPHEAVKGADVVYTDTWISMHHRGKKGEWERRIRTFKPYQVNSKLLKKAKDDAIVMHCLPAHRGYEITDDVMDGRQSVVWQQAENRLHVQKAILALIL